MAEETKATKSKASGKGNVGFSLALIVLGLIHYYLSWTSNGFATTWAWILVIIGGMAFAAKFEDNKDKLAIILPFIFFFIWFYLFNSTKTSGIYFLIGFVMVSTLIGIKTKGEEAIPIIYGFALILIFFVTTGYLEWLAGEFNVQIAEPLRIMITMIPFWSFVGLVAYPETESNFFNSLGTIIKLAGLVYLILLLPLTSAIPNFGYEKLLPSDAQRLEAQQVFREKGISPLLPMKCLYKSIINIQATKQISVDECVNQEKKLAQAKWTCEDKGFPKNSEGFNNCIKQQLAEKEEQKTMEGAVSDIIKQVTEAKINIDDGFFPKLTDKKRETYSATLGIKNPRKQDITVTVGCLFQKDKGNVNGIVVFEGEEKDQFIFSELEDSFPFKCTPSSDLDNGDYQLLITATFSGLTTSSYITRAFLGKMEESTMKEKIAEIKLDRFSSNKDLVSKAPAEFARINFAFGVTTERDPVIPVDKIVSFYSNVENTGRGEITKINSYYFDLLEKGFTVKSGTANCLQGSGTSVVKSKTSPLTSCFLALPVDMKYITDSYKIETFVAILNYDYQITEKRSTRVKVSNLVS